jgi:uncharacterized membrane protein YccC
MSGDQLPKSLDDDPAWLHVNYHRAAVERAKENLDAALNDYLRLENEAARKDLEKWIRRYNTAEATLVGVELDQVERRES